MEPTQSKGSPEFTHKNLHLRTAESYKNLRKDEEEWTSIIDVSPQLAEFQHFVKAGAYDTAFEVLETVAPHLITWGYYVRLTELRERIKDYIENPKYKMINISKLAVCYNYTNRALESAEMAEKGITMATDLGDYFYASRLHVTLANCCIYRGKVFEGFEVFEKGCELAVEHSIVLIEALNRHFHSYWRILIQGQSYQLLNGLIKASDLFKAEEKNNERFNIYWASRQQHCNCMLGRLHERIGLYDEALGTLEHVVKKSKQLNDQMGLTMALKSLGDVYAGKFQIERAKEYYLDAAEIGQKIGFPMFAAAGLNGMVDINRSLAAFSLITGQGNHDEAFEEAVTYYEKAIALDNEKVDIPHLAITHNFEANNHHEWGLAHLDAGNADEAGRLFKTSEEHHRKVVDTHQETDEMKLRAWLDHSRCLILSGNHAGSMQLLQNVSDNSESFSEIKAFAALFQGIANLGDEQSEKAKEFFGKSRKLCEDRKNEVAEIKKEYKIDMPRLEAEPWYTEVISVAALATVSTGDDQEKLRKEAEELLKKAFGIYRSPDFFRSLYYDLKILQVSGTSAASESVQPLLDMLRDDVEMYLK